jgi:hypothetical protein
MRIAPCFVCPLVLAALSGPAAAHHPGSHAARQPDGRVRVEVATLVADSCTSLGPVTAGAPPAVRPAAGAMPVTAQLRRPPGAACTGAVTRLTGEATVEAGRDVRQIMLYILAPDGTVVSSERLPLP